ncbi:hypothetical protein [Streptomyces griseofuscus]|uniref:hypothetical protein n=1 Tax=Streptomyces griseofuscus TaxID=146922 RepID=UPI0038281407
MAAAPVAVNPAGGTAYRLAVPVQGDGNNFHVYWAPEGNSAESVTADGTVTLSGDQKSYKIAGNLSMSGASAQTQCKYFHGGTTMSVRRDGEEWTPSGPKRWGWKRISDERACNDLINAQPMHFEYTGQWDLGDDRVLIDIRSNPYVGSYMYSGNARCERRVEKFNCTNPQ